MGWPEWWVEWAPVVGVLAMLSVPAMHAVQALLALRQCRRVLLWLRGTGGQGLVWALEKDAAVGEEFTLGGAAVLRWEEHVPWFAERQGLEFVDARLPKSNFFEFDLGKINGLLGYGPRHDARNVVERAEAIRRGRKRGWCRRGFDMEGMVIRGVRCAEYL